MPSDADFCPVFASPPVFKTRIGVQFHPLVGFKSGHFGLFWEECLGLDEWQIMDDMGVLPTEAEKFGDKRLRPPVEDDAVDFPSVRMQLTNTKQTRTVEFQPNRLRYGWGREDGRRPSYSEVKNEFAKLVGKLEEFAAKWELGKWQPNFWEVVYTNLIPPGVLWQTPADWHKVLPTIFPPGGPVVRDHLWSSFSGDWYFDITPQCGRVKVKVQKVVANQTGDISLLLEVAARGSLGSPGASTWAEGVEIGHRSAVRVFYDIASPDARQQWGVQS